jgi:hypothetical protein
MSSVEILFSSIVNLVELETWSNQEASQLPARAGKSTIKAAIQKAAQIKKLLASITFVFILMHPFSNAV